MRILPVFLTAVVLALPAPVLAEDQRAMITVTGEGRVDAAPDMATISLGVTTQDKTAALALSANSVEMAKIVDRLRAAGIEDRDLQTSGLSLSPDFDYSKFSGRGEIIGYVVSNMLTVRVRALDKLGTLLDAAVADGANALNGVSFGLTNPDPVMTEARKRAVAEARARAELLTGAAGVELGRIVSMSESSAQIGPAPMFRAEASVADAMPVPVQAGELSTSAYVTITWEIKE
jgi:uncharacterized protein